MSKGIFITGTDTGVGKTEIALALIEKYKGEGLRVAAMKPVASGAELVEGMLQNDDARRLRAACNVELDYAQVNPFVFEEPIAPHIAAANAGVRIDVQRIARIYADLCARADRVIVEGVGGWWVPLNETMRVSDIARRLEIPVVLVVGLRLGCLNHALLSDAAIKDCDVACVGWVANRIDPDFRYVDDNIATLQREIVAPLLGIVAYQDPLQPLDVADAIMHPAVSDERSQN